MDYPNNPNELAEQLAGELRLHDRAMGASSCGITIADASLTDVPLIYINDSFTRITGYTPAETLGRNCRFLQLNDRDQPELTALRTAMKTGGNCTVVIRNYRRDGTLFWNELFTSPVKNAEGSVTHFVGIQTDVTERIRAQQELVLRKLELEATLTELRDTQSMLIQSEKMNALGQMVAGVAHEINNPVSFVNSNIYSLKNTIDEIAGAYTALEDLIKTTGTTDQQTAVQVIRTQADLDYLIGDVGDLITSSLNGLNRVKKIVEALRTFSHLDEAELKLTDLRADIQSTLVIARLELKDRVQVELDMDNLPPIKAYPAELNQVFLNIIVNAAQAIEGKGKLTIRGRDAGDRVVLEFSDTGKGMTPEVMRQIFNPFFTTKPVGSGTGLGLAIAHKIINARHKGQIQVDSTPGAGTTFTIDLPKDLHE